MGRTIILEDILFSHPVELITTFDQWLARAMTRRRSGLVARIREVVTGVRWEHCSIHREALPVNGGRLWHCSENCYFIKKIDLRIARTPSCRGWLSRGKVFTLLFELRTQMQLFLSTSLFQLKNSLKDSTWLLLSACIADVFHTPIWVYLWSSRNFFNIVECERQNQHSDSETSLIC
jgi:hypothetical protein